MAMEDKKYGMGYSSDLIAERLAEKYGGKLFVVGGRSKENGI